MKVDESCENGWKRMERDENGKKWMTNDKVLKSEIVKGA